MDQADLIIIVLDGSEPLQEEDERLLAMTEGRTRIVAWNKADLGTAHEGICISAKHEDIHPLTDEIHRLFDEHRIVLEQPSLANERQLSLMLMAKVPCFMPSTPWKAAWSWSLWRSTCRNATPL